MAIYSSKLVGNSFDVLIDEANRARETYGAGVEKFQNMIKPRKKRMLTTIQSQNEMSRKLGVLARAFVDEAASCYKEAEQEKSNIKWRKGIGICVTVVSTLASIALIVVPLGRVHTTFTHYLVFALLPYS